MNNPALIQIYRILREVHILSGIMVEHLSSNLRNPNPLVHNLLVKAWTTLNRLHQEISSLRTLQVQVLGDQEIVEHLTSLAEMIQELQLDLHVVIRAHK